MIDFLEGIILRKANDKIILQVGSIGYEVFCPSRAILSWSQEENVRVYTVQMIREDMLRLFGFQSLEERDFFLTLMKVSGVGPRLSLAILSMYNPLELASFILNEDIAQLTRVSGLGRKGAQRLIVELNDRLEKEKNLFSQEESVNKEASYGSPWYDAICALRQLGISEKEAKKRVASLKDKEPELDDVQDILKKSF